MGGGEGREASYVGFGYHNTFFFYFMLPLFLDYIAVLRKLAVEIHSVIGLGYF